MQECSLARVVPPGLCRVVWWSDCVFVKHKARDAPDRLAGHYRNNHTECHEGDSGRRADLRPEDQIYG